MPFQPQTLRVARVPGVIDLTAAELQPADIVAIANGAPGAAQTTLTELLAFFGIVPFITPARVITANAQLPMTSTDFALLINKTIAGATNVALAAPSLGRLALIKDMKGDADVNNITLDAGAGRLINGQQTLVMNAQWGATLLIGASATQWGTVI